MPNPVTVRTAGILFGGDKVLALEDARELLPSGVP
jgi:hypothetical protein